jgi:hypothetical protein
MLHYKSENTLGVSQSLHRLYSTHRSLDFDICDKVHPRSTTLVHSCLTCQEKGLEGGRIEKEIPIIKGLNAE